MANKQLINEVAAALKGFGYRVFIAESGTYGFYTDAAGSRVVSFGSHWDFYVDFSGNYHSKGCGTGWQIAKEKCGVTEDEARAYFAENPPYWATKGESVTLTTLAQHMATYGASSRYSERV